MVMHPATLLPMLHVRTVFGIGEEVTGHFGHKRVLNVDVVEFHEQVDLSDPGQYPMSICL